MKSILFISFVWILLNAACKQEDICLQPQVIVCRSGFYQLDSASNYKDSSLSNANILFKAQDTLYLINMKSNNGFSLPLSIQNDSTLLLFQSDSTNITSSTIDTVYLYYHRSLKFISLACGYQYNFEMKNVSFTKHVLDSVFISNATVDAEANKQHIKYILKKP